MLRYGQRMARFLKDRAIRRLMRMRWTHLDDSLTTRQRKRVRQILRQMESGRGTVGISSPIGKSRGDLILLARRAIGEFMSVRANEPQQKGGTT